jgi:hypothetical protein
MRLVQLHRDSHCKDQIKTRRSEGRPFDLGAVASALCAAIIEPLVGAEDEATDEVSAFELEALDQFGETIPITLAGLMATVFYACEINGQNVDALDRDTPIFNKIAITALACWETVVKRKPPAADRTRQEAPRFWRQFQTRSPPR